MFKITALHNKVATEGFLMMTTLHHNVAPGGLLKIITLHNAVVPAGSMYDFVYIYICQNLVLKIILLHIICELGIRLNDR
jgi:hypothetical protein